MAPARFGIAALQPVVIAIEKNNAQIEIVLFRETIERFDERWNREIARAHIDADGKRQMRRRRHDQIGQQRERQVIDRFVAHVLEGFERRRAPRSGHAGDDEEPLGRDLSRCAHSTAGAATQP